MYKRQAYACAAHGDTRRKGDGAPAVLHALEAAAVAAGLTDDEEVLAAAVLHDTVEDTGARLEDIEARFGPRVAALVEAESEDKMRHLPPEQSWLARKEAAVAQLRACLLYTSKEPASSSNRRLGQRHVALHKFFCHLSSPPFTKFQIRCRDRRHSRYRILHIYLCQPLQSSLPGR